MIFTRKELAFLFVTIGGAALIDSINDLHDGATWGHVAAQLTFGALILTFLAWVMRLRVRKMAASMEESRQRLEELKREAEEWKAQSASLKPRVGEAIDRQLSLWQLSNAEKDVTRLVLKGLSNKEISDVRSSTEQTIKQQINAVFRKSGLTTRAQLIAFFLEDLF